VREGVIRSPDPADRAAGVRAWTSPIQGVIVIVMVASADPVELARR
jgi:hypothetical protein